MSTTAILEAMSHLENTPGKLRENWCVPRETGRFLHVMALATGATRICEVGTSIGYSTLWLADAAAQNKGHVTTLEAFEGRQEQAKASITAAGLSAFVTFRLGEALPSLQQLQTENAEFDLAFIDAAKKNTVIMPAIWLPCFVRVDC